jgi:predicted aspartyl protease
MDHHGEVNSINIDASESIDTVDPTLELIEVELTGDDGMPTKVLALPDTGASITVVSQEVWECTGRELSPIRTSTRSADGGILKTIGKTRYVIEYQKKRVETEVEVVQGLTTMILALNVLKRLGIVSASFPHLKEDQTKTDSANEFQTKRKIQNPKTFEKEEREGVKEVVKSPKHSKKKKGKERKRLRKAQKHRQF